ncbi:MAG: hemerythrin family protein [Spirochaetes bacterium]|nr:hemerythrin family protein [Spirochaetota bacterium]
MIDFEWRDEYSVGVAAIDHQHQSLFALARRAVALGDDATNEVELLNLVQEMEDYANRHFALEEKLMREASYSEYDDHKKMHDFMRVRLELVSKQLKKHELTKHDLVEFLESWLTEHIIMEDLRYIPVMKTNFKRKNTDG